jgi:hypothetical protein
VQLKLPRNPLLHLQSFKLSLAAGEVALSKHCMQAALPVKLLYVPGRQAWQPPPSPSDAVKPLLQMQLMSDSLPMGEEVPGGQKRHVFPDAAITAEYLPAGHLMQAPKPGRSLKVPAGHAPQVKAPFSPSTRV